MRPKELFSLFNDVSRVKGVGPAAREALIRLLPKRDAAPGEAAGPIVRDLLFHLPVGIIDRRYSPSLSDKLDNVIGTVVVRVDEHAPLPARTRGGKKPPYRVYCSNETGSLQLVYFNARSEYVTGALPVGEWRVVSGTLESIKGGVQMVHPDVVAPLSDIETVRKVDPVYPLTYGLGNRQLGKSIQSAFTFLPALPEWIDGHLIAQKGWRSWKDAVTQAHAPELLRDLDPSSPARERLAYDELLANQLALGLVRERLKREAGVKVTGNGTLRKKLIAHLPYQLTDGQKKVLREIDGDMASGNRMLRLLQGDVGSGKTVVATFAMLSAIEEGKQAAFMAPTEILARQHLQELEAQGKELGFRVALLTGSVKGKAREEILAAIAAGEIDIVIGTHALFQDQVVFNKLSVIVIDEQHRFGVAQRMALASKGEGEKPHILLMTATPIPRSLTMTYFGDMDSSLLTEKPAGRKAIDTRAIPLSRIHEVVEGLKRAIAAGSKVYWICPLVEEKTEAEGAPTPEGDLAAAETRHRVFQEIFGARVGLMHGRMKGDERERVMNGFSGDAYDMLVATTVVEVGVNVPSATVMVIEHAERFGLSQLHQLRGRVGRSDKPSNCILLYHERAGEVAQERLKIIRETNDGFKIAEEDLRLRGSGDVLGTKQSGYPEFRFANLLEQGELIRTARDDAKLILHNDAALKTPRGQALRILLYLFDYDVSVRYLQSG